MSTVDPDPIALRIARILDSKARENKEVLSALNVAEEAWERLNKEVDTSIGTEFDLLATERAAVLGAKDRLDNPDEDPAEDGFVFTGRVFDRTTHAGLPQLYVRVLSELSPEPLADTFSEGAGMYRVVITTDRFDPGSQISVTVEVFTAPGEGRPIGGVKRTVAMRAGGVERVDVAVRRVGGIGDRITAAEAARDSVEETVASVERRLESMKAAHTATTRFADLTRDGLRELSDAMATEPPPIPGSVEIAGVEPVAPPEPLTSTSLQEIEGIGPRRAETLRAAGIPDVESFVRAKPDRLAELLGPERTKDAVVAAEKLLARR